MVISDHPAQPRSVKNRKSHQTKFSCDSTYLKMKPSRVEVLVEKACRSEKAFEDLKDLEEKLMVDPKDNGKLTLKKEKDELAVRLSRETRSQHTLFNCT